jgi:hypothetical protein
MDRSPGDSAERSHQGTINADKIVETFSVLPH